MVQMGEAIYMNEKSNIRISINDNNTFYAHFHKHIELIHVLEGNYTVYSKDNCYHLSKGDTYISFPYMEHRYQREGRNKIFIAILSVDYLTDYSELLLYYRPRSPLIRCGELPDYFEKLLVRTDELSTSENNIDRRVFDGYLSVVIGEVLQKLDFVEYKCELSATVENILTYCYRNSGNPELNLASVAESFGFSETYISQVLKKATGHGLPYILKSLRLGKSRGLLHGTTKGIADIAFECGFSNLRTYNRAFLDAFGFTPSDFRKRCRDIPNREKNF